MIRVAGKGEAGEFGGPPGDLFVVTTILKNDTFERKDCDLYKEEKISYKTACLGGEIKVNTINGTVTMKIPPETQCKKMFRIKGKGMPDLHNSRMHGDLFVKVFIDIPGNLDDTQKKLLIELDNMIKAG